MLNYRYNNEREILHKDRRTNLNNQIISRSNVVGLTAVVKIRKSIATA